MIYFIADPHGGHNRVLEFCKKTRPFKSIEEHDQHFIDSWNRTVINEDDEVYVLGDFSFHSEARDTRKFYHSLRGIKHLIIGNHDKQATLHLPWETKQHYHELKIQKHRFVLFHYPIKEGQWNAAHHGSILLYGHVHGSPQYTVPVRAMDVGVDAIGFSPISADDVIKKMTKINKFVPHHEKE